MQLEEANRTLTSDVANLANEKEELNNKMKEALEGKRNLIFNILFLHFYLQATHFFSYTLIFIYI